jgi:lipopolysaccharide exporter
MEQRAVAGFRWTLLTYAVGKVITLASTVVLARLLNPADFGVVMLAFVAINVVGLFGDLGLGATLVVRQELDRRGTGTVLTLLIGTGVLLGALLVMAAPFLADVFDEHRLGGVLVALAPLTVLGSVNWFYQWLLQRELEFRTRFMGHLAQALVYGTTAVTAAALGAREWSIVAGHLAGTVAMTVVFLASARTRVRPAFDRTIVRSLFATSRGFLLQSTATLLQQNADYIAVGRTLGSTPLGLYSMAYRLSELPHLAVADPVARVTFPGFTRMRLRGEDVRRHYLRTLRMVAVFTGPVGAVLSAVVAPFTLVVYGRRWVPMAGALSILALWGVVKSAQVTMEAALNSAGGSDDAGVTALAVLALQVPALFVAAAAGGLVAVAWVIVAGACLSALVLVARLRRRLGVGFAAHRRALTPVVVACLAAWLSARGVSHVLRDASSFLALAAAVTCGLVAYFAVLAVLAPGAVGEAVDQIRGSARADSSISDGPAPTAAPGPFEAAPGGEAPVAPRGTGVSGEAHRGSSPGSS